MPLIQWITQNLAGGVPTFQSTGGIVVSGSALPRLGLIYVPIGGVTIGGGGLADAVIFQEEDQSIYFRLIINSFYQTRFILDIGDILPNGFRVRSLRQYVGTNQYLIENYDGELQWINDSEVPIFEDYDNRRLDEARDRVYETLRRLLDFRTSTATINGVTRPYTDQEQSGFNVYSLRMGYDGLKYLVSNPGSNRREISSEELEEWASGELYSEKIARQVSKIASRLDRLSRLILNPSYSNEVILGDGEIPVDNKNQILERRTKARDRVYATLRRLSNFPTSTTTTNGVTQPYIDQEHLGLNVYSLRISQDGIKYLVSNSGSIRHEISSEELEEWASGELYSEKTAQQVTKIASQLDRLSRLTLDPLHSHEVMFEDGEIPVDNKNRILDNRAKALAKLARLSEIINC